MTATPRPTGAARGPLDRGDHLALAAGSPPDPAGRAPVVVLATAYSGAARLRPLLERLPDLAFTSGTGILPLCEQALAAWRKADGRPGQPPSALAISSTRALAGVIITSVLAREGKRRWCEASTSMPETGEAFLRLYPAARFVCLYRSCTGVIRAALDANPWGMADPVLAPFTRAHPASTAAALASYWAAHTAGLLAFEQSHPQAVLRVRLEDLFEDEQRTSAAVTSFLSTASLDGGDTAARGRALPELGTSGAAAGPPAQPEAGLPSGLLPPGVLARANGLLRQLGYPGLPE